MSGDKGILVSWDGLLLLETDEAICKKPRMFKDKGRLFRLKFVLISLVFKRYNWYTTEYKLEAFTMGCCGYTAGREYIKRRCSRKSLRKVDGAKNNYKEITRLAFLGLFLLFQYFTGWTDGKM